MTKWLNRPWRLNDWNTFREMYCDLSFCDRELISGELDKLFPQQTHYRLDRFMDMFKLVNVKNPNVIELGCNQGQLARACLKRLPNIKYWTGYDFEAPIKRNVVKYARYEARSLKDWFHNIEIENPDVFVCSHTIEHMSNDEAEKTFNHVRDANYLMLEIPVKPEGQNWYNYRGTHVLKYGQKDIHAMLLGLGFKLIYEERQPWSTMWENKYEH